MNDDKIIDFGREMEKRHGPDSGHIYTDESGVKWFEYECCFHHDNKKFSFKIWAKSEEDANDKMNAIIETGQVSGKIYHEEDTK